MSAITFRTNYKSIVVYNAELKTELEINLASNRVSFSIDNSYSFASRKNRITITRWLMSAWQWALMHYPNVYLICDCYDGDGYEDYRANAYRKLGFSQVAPYTLVWGNLEYFFLYDEEGQQIKQQFDDMVSNMTEQELEEYLAISA